MPSLDLGPVVGPQGEQGATGAQGIRGEQGLPGPNQVTNSTATPLTGVLTGNGSVVGVASIDEAPTADSTGFAQSGGTDKAIKARVPVYGMGKNLLDNAYFVGGGSQLGDGVFPINQRGQASYSTEGYTIDRWFFNRYSYGTLTLTAAGLQITKNGATSNPGLRQDMEHDLDGRIVTFSALDDAGNLYPFTSGTLDNTVSEWQATNNFGVIWVGIRYISGKWSVSVTTPGITLVALKLELGTEQTLCHNEGTAEAPVWVLNEVPDYEYELYYCMTSTANLNDTYANKSIATEQQLAYVETGTTSSRAYAVGDLFCWNGLLYRAKEAISSGAAFTPGTNCEQKIAFQTFSDASTTITDNTCVSSVDMSKCESVGNIASIVATINLTGQVPTSRYTFGQLHNIPKPIQNVSALVQVGNYLFAVQITVDGLFCIMSVGAASGGSGWTVRVNIVYLTNGNIIS